MKIAFNNSKPGIMAKILPFLSLGIMIVLMLVGVFLLSYLLIFGALVGLILFIVSFVMGKFRGAKNGMTKHESEKAHTEKPEGKTYDYKDIK